MNKYCGQHLIIANEIQEESEPAFPTHRTRSTLHRYDDADNSGSDEDASDGKGEPVAEALIQNDQQFHHLKILKSAGDEQTPIEPPIKPTKSKNTNANSKNRRVYSQVRSIIVIIIIVIFGL